MNDISMMQRVPGGTFRMGAEGWGPYEGPVREVAIEEFLLDPTPVTNAAFTAFAKDTGHVTTAERRGSALGYKDGQMQQIGGLCWRSFSLAGREEHPVVLVSWHDAAAYATWAGKRLPLEAEWEKAARGGHEQKLYPWGDAEPSSLHCNFARALEDIPPTTRVGQYPANAFGLFDMAGNVWNWCGNAFQAAGQPVVNGTSEAYARRGGAFNVIQPFRLRCANRGAFDPKGYAINLGFRCAQSL